MSYTPKSISELLLLAEERTSDDAVVKHLVMGIRENDHTWHASRSRMDAIINRLPPVLGRHATLDTTIVDAATSMHKAEHTIFYLASLLVARLNEITDYPLEW